MSGIPPLQNQENAYRSEVAGMQMAAENAKEETVARSLLDRSKTEAQEKLDKVQDVKKVDEIREKNDDEERDERKEQKRGKSLSGGSLLDALAE